MKTETDRTTQTAEEVLDELRSLVSEAEKILAQTPQGACNCDTPLRERLEAAQERLSAVYRGTKQKVVAGAKYADETVRENPYQSMAVALGIGVLVGVLVGRRWKSSE